MAFSANEWPGSSRKGFWVVTGSVFGVCWIGQQEEVMSSRIQEAHLEPSLSSDTSCLMDVGGASVSSATTEQNSSRG